MQKVSNKARERALLRKSLTMGGTDMNERDYLQMTDTIFETAQRALEVYRQWSDKDSQEKERLLNRFSAMYEMIKRLDLEGEYQDWREENGLE